MSSDPKQHLVEITHAHRIVATGLGEWCCACEPMRWRTGWHSSHLADAILAAGYERRRDVAGGGRAQEAGAGMSANQSRGYLAPGGERGPHDPRPRYVNDLLTVCDWCGHRLERVPGRPKVWWHA